MACGMIFVTHLMPVVSLCLHKEEDQCHKMGQKTICLRSIISNGTHCWTSVNQTLWKNLFYSDDIHLVEKILIELVHLTSRAVNSYCINQKQSSGVVLWKSVPRNFAKLTGKHLCQRLFFNSLTWNFIKKEPLAQVFFCQFCEISKNIIFYGTPTVWGFFKKDIFEKRELY